MSLRRILPLALGASCLGGAALAQTLDPAVSGDLALERVAEGLQGAVGADWLPDGRLVFIEQLSGRVAALRPGSAAIETLGNLAVETGGERGLLGIAVDPAFARTGRLYLYYSAGGAQRVGHIRLDPGTGRLDPASLTVLLDGLAAERNHDGGAIAFGPDGHLYVGVGDTGCNCNCAPGTNQQNFFPTCLTSLHGKILRIDREGRVPADNPLVGVSAVPACGGGGSCATARTRPAGTGAPRTEIWAWGFRNPWRFAFDAATGHLWVGDVGEVTFEEITVVSRGGAHHGWPFREGADGQDASSCAGSTPTAGACVDPAFSYPHDERPAQGQASVTGGVFSSHCAWPAAYRGRYWFGDYNKGRVWTLTPNAARDGVVGARTTVVSGAAGPVHFLEGRDASIYFLGVNDGSIWRIVPRAPEACPEPDAGVHPDAASPDADAPDAASPDADAPDAGSAGGDAAEPEPVTDAAVLDAGRADAATGDAGTEPAEGGGCGCRAGSARPETILGMLALLGLAALRRRR